MKKLQIYLDETYNLQSDNQFFCIAGFTTFEPEEILTEYNENIEISINVEVDKNDKIKRAFYKELEIRLKEQHNIKWINIETLHSNTSFGLQLADQITGIVRENIKEKNYSEFIRKFKNIVINPLSKN